MCSGSKTIETMLYKLIMFARRLLALVGNSASVLESEM